MVALARRGLAFLVIAACAASALAAEEAGGSESFIAIGLEKSPRPEGSHPARLGVKPILGGAAIGTALLAAIVYFGLKVLGTKIVEVDAKEAGNRLAEEVLNLTSSFTLVTKKYTAWIEITAQQPISPIKKLTATEKRTWKERNSSALQTFLDCGKGEGESTCTVQVAGVPVTIVADMRRPNPQTNETSDPSSGAHPKDQ